MQASELVTGEVWQKFLAEHHIAAGIADKKGCDATRLALEAVALDLYERGLRDAADYIAGLGEQYEAAAVSAKTRKDANYFRGRARMYAQDAAAILSKLRAPA